MTDDKMQRLKDLAAKWEEGAANLRSRARDCDEEQDEEADALLEMAEIHQSHARQLLAVLESWPMAGLELDGSGKKHAWRMTRSDADEHRCTCGAVRLAPSIDGPKGQPPQVLAVMYRVRPSTVWSGKEPPCTRKG